MRQDNYGQQIFTEQELCDIFMSDPTRTIAKTYTEQPIIISDELELDYVPELVEYVTSIETVEEFDTRLQSNWYMPEEYKNLDIVVWLLDQCKTDDQRQRVGHELLLYLDRNLFPLLQYLKYLVDTMTKHNIVWGVGRGSSVSSYVLYLIGVHRIDSMYYDLQVEDFLR